MAVESGGAAKDADEDCPGGPFETDLLRIEQTPPHGRVPVKDLQDANDAVPAEVSRVLDGAVSCFRGGLMNEGITTWYAFDIERRLFLAVLGAAGHTPGRQPQRERLGADQLLRHTDAAGYERAEFVTVAEATPAQVREFSCLANRLVAGKADRLPDTVPQDAIGRSFALLREGRPLDIGRGFSRSPTVGELERFMKQPLQEAILRALAGPE